jgi:polysaccharide deacetylase family protein (PEP-CTERM system associated)
LNKTLISVDVEDGINIALRDYFGIQINPTERVLSNTDVILALLERHDVKGTFFILGEIAQHYPELVKKIYSHGHELSVHGLTHKQYFKLNPTEVKKEITYTKALLENLCGCTVLGHRAPAFSITPANKWALQLVQEAGFTYDSSIVPAITSRYGWPGFKKEIVNLELPNGGHLIEVPISVASFFGKSIPVGGGGYLKFFPFWLTNHLISKIQKQRPAMVYLHPYEVDTDRYPEFFHQAAAKAGISKKLKIKTFQINKKTVLPKLEFLLSTYQFTNLKAMLNELDPESLEKVNI